MTDKDNEILRLVAENETLQVELERMRAKCRELQAQQYLGKQFVEETQHHMVQIHVQAVAKVAAAENRHGQLQPYWQPARDPRWDIS